MLQILAAALLAWGFARVLDAPRWVERSIPLVAITAVAAVLLLLPAESAFRQGVAGGIRTLAVFGGIAVPLAAYLYFVRRLKARAGPESVRRDHVTGMIVRIIDDTALRAEIAPEADGYSLIRRDAAGALELAASLDREGDRLIIRDVWWRDGTDLGGLGEATIAAATEDGVAQVILTHSDPQLLEAFRAAGYHEAMRVGLAGAADLVTLVWTRP